MTCTSSGSWVTATSKSPSVELRARTALGSLPHGTFAIEEEQDDGALWKATITISPERFLVDLTGNPRQRNAPYNTSAAYVSDDPFSFDMAHTVMTFPAHGAEVVQAGDRWYVSSCGWEQGGLYLADLNWDDKA